MQIRTFSIDSDDNTVLGSLHEIDDGLVAYSPFLSTMKDGPFGEYKDEEAFALEVEDHVLSVYLSFLRGESFTLDGKAAAFFDKMGHSNHMKYPLDFWAVKLHDNWVRDHMYRRNLHEDPLYDLVELPVKNKFNEEIEEYLTLVPGWYIAGGAALYLAGYADKYSDIDLFTCMSKEEANASLEKVTRIRDEKYGDSYYPFIVSGNAVTMRVGRNHTGIKMQHILRVYKSPSEIVHGFDLDCVGIVYINGKLYATKRTMFALEKKMNFFDPARASPSYAYRLLKYKGRGFDIFLPLFHPRFITGLKPFLKSVTSELKSEIEPYMSEKARKFIEAHTKNGMFQLPEREIYELTHLLSEQPSLGELISYSRNEKLLPKHPVDLFILAIYANIYPTSHLRKEASDYERKEKQPKKTHSEPDDDDFSDPVDEVEPEEEDESEVHYQWMHEMTEFEWEGKTYRVKEEWCSSIYPHPKIAWQYDFDPNAERYPFIFRLRTDRLHWREQDPMAQVSSTCYPSPIDDIREWYSTSSLYQDDPAYEPEVVSFTQKHEIHIEISYKRAICHVFIYDDYTATTLQ